MQVACFDESASIGIFCPGLRAAAPARFCHVRVIFALTAVAKHATPLIIVNLQFGAAHGRA
jgi:hypothetical protein